MRRFVSLLALVSFIVSSIAPTSLAIFASHVVISEVAIGIGAAANEFVELYNPTASPINLSTAGLKLHIVGSTGTDTNKTLTFVTTTIPAYGFFLIASTGYVAAMGVAADATYSASSNALVSNGAVYISTSAAAGVGVIDALDYGTDTSNVGEGSATADIPANESIERKAYAGSLAVTMAASGTHAAGGNGWDTDDNAADFALRATPLPQHTSSSIEMPDTLASTTTASPAAGTYVGTQSVVLAADESATIRYTTDGSDPTTSGTTAIYSTPLTIATDTTLRYFATDAAGNIEAAQTSSYAITAPADTTPPASISALTVTAGDTFLDLAWTNPNDDFAGVIVLRSTSAITTAPVDVASFSVGDAVGSATVAYVGTGTTTSIVSLTNGTPIYIAVYAYDAVRNYSPAVTGSSTPADVTAPTEVSGLIATTDDGVVSLAWHPSTSDDVARYLVTVGADAPVDVGNVTTYVASSLTNGTPLTFRVAAYDEVPNVSSGVTITATPAPRDTTAPTTTASPAGGSFVGTQTISLTADETATIHYTIDGSDPATGAVYTAPLTFAADTTLRYAATDASGNAEVAKTAMYVIRPIAQGDIVINEFLSAPTTGGEWIELFNTTGNSLALAGITLADNVGIAHTFGSDTIIAGGYALISFSSARLNNAGDTLRLATANDVTLDALTYGSYDDGDISDNLAAPGSGESLGRRGDGGVHFFTLPTPTMGAANPTPPTRASDISLIISEVDFKNTSHDAVEIFVADDGQAGAGVDLGGFTFTDDGIFKTVADGTTLRTGDYIVLTFDSSSADEVVATDGILHLYAPHTGLVSTDEELVIADGYGAVEDAVAWATDNSTDVEIADLATLAARGGWSGAAIASSEVGTGKAIARPLASGAYVDTNAASDFIVRTSSMGVANTNTAPTAMITTQSASSCSLSINLDGSGSSDTEGDALAYAWDYGDGHFSTAANPDYHAFATGGTYVVRLIVTDGVGASASASVSFTVAACGGVGGSSSSRGTTIDVPTIESVSADRVRLLITEVSFHNTPDWVEVYVADDGAGGAGVDLGGFIFEDDKAFKTIPRGFTARTGEYFTLTFGSDASDDATPPACGHPPCQGGSQLYTSRAGLTATDEQIILKDSRGMIEDAVVWGDMSGAWSRGEDDDVAALATAGVWTRTDEAGAFDARSIEKGWSVARKVGCHREERVSRSHGRDQGDVAIPLSGHTPRDCFAALAMTNKYVDTNSSSDFFATPFPTKGMENGAPPTMAADVRLLLTAVDFKNAAGDSLTISCLDCASDGTDLTGFFVKLADTTIATLPRGFVLRAGESLEIRFEKEKIDDVSSRAQRSDPVEASNANQTTSFQSDGIASPPAAVRNDNIIFTIDRDGLTNADGLISIKDFAETTEDFVCWTDRLAPRGREYDLTIAEVTQLEKRAREGEWSGVVGASCLDSREVKRGQMIVRRSVIASERGDPVGITSPPAADGNDKDFVDTNSSADWAVIGVATEETITKMTSRDIHLTELFPNPVGPDAGVEWWEVANLGTKPIELAGWSAAIGRSSFTFEDSFILAPNSYAAMTGLPIRNGGGTLTLIDPFGALIDEVTYPELSEDVAYARTSRGWDTTLAPTRGLPNGGLTILPRAADPDADGLSDLDERRLRTDPATTDTDGDGLPDGFEVEMGFDPRVVDANESARAAYRLDLTRLTTGSLAAIASDATGFTLTGRGVPDGRVRLFVQSTLRIVDVAVDADGAWTYALDIALEAGHHNVFVQPLDRAGFAGVASKVLSFTRDVAFVPPTFPNIRLSEILPNPAGKDAGSEFVEVENLSMTSASLAGWQLRVGRKTLTLDGEIAPRGYVVLRGLGLPNSGDEVRLIRPDGRAVETVTYPKIKETVSFARDADGWRETALSTPDGVNVFVAVVSKARAKKQSVVYRDGDSSNEILISEVLPNPVGSDTKAEWIEMQNVGTRTVRLGNWQLDDGVGGSRPFVIPNTVVLAPYAFHLFPRTLTKLSLNNTGTERVRLFDPRGRLVSEVTFVDVPEGSAIAREPLTPALSHGERASYRLTRILTPDRENVFDTLRLDGIVRHVGVDGLLLETSAGEVWIRFTDRGASLVARATLVVGMHVSSFVSLDGGRYTLDDFTADTPSVTLTPQPVVPTDVAIFVALAIAVAFVGMWRRDRLLAFLPTSR